MKIRSKTAIITVCIFLYTFIFPAVGIMIWGDNHQDLKTDNSIVTRDCNDYTSTHYYTSDGSLDFKGIPAGSGISIYYGGCSNRSKSDND